MVVTLNKVDIMECLAENCVYNKDKKCHTYAITVGSSCPECDTYYQSQGKKGGVSNVIGEVGACRMINCAFNANLECSAPGIRVELHRNHAECATFREK